MVVICPNLLPFLWLLELVFLQKGSLLSMLIPLRCRWWKGENLGGQGWQSEPDKCWMLSCGFHLFLSSKPLVFHNYFSGLWRDRGHVLYSHPISACCLAPDLTTYEYLVIYLLSFSLVSCSIIKCCHGIILWSSLYRQQHCLAWQGEQDWVISRVPALCAHNCDGQRTLADVKTQYSAVLACRSSKVDLLLCWKQTGY